MITNTNMQVTKLRIALANDSSANIKLSNNQISKTVYPRRFLYTGILIYYFDNEASLVNVLGVFGKSLPESLEKKAAKNLLYFAFNKLNNKDFRFCI